MGRTTSRAPRRSLWPRVVKRLRILHHGYSHESLLHLCNEIKHTVHMYLAHDTSILQPDQCQGQT